MTLFPLLVVSLAGDTDMRAHNLAQETVMAIFHIFTCMVAEPGTDIAAKCWMRQPFKYWLPAVAQALAVKAAARDGASRSNGIKWPDPQALHALGQVGARRVEGVARTEYSWRSWSAWNLTRIPRSHWSTTCLKRRVDEEITVRDVQRAHSVDQRRSQPIGEELRRPGWLRNMEEATQQRGETSSSPRRSRTCVRRERPLNRGAEGAR